MSKRKKIWKEHNWARDKRTEPLVIEEEPQTLTDYIMEIGEEAYEDEVIAMIEERLG